MKANEVLKKFWFIFLIALLAIGFIGYYTYDSIKNKPVTVKTKNVDGKDVIYSIGEDNYTADDLYSELYSQIGKTAAFTKYERMIIDEAVETTSEMRETAANSAAYLLTQYSEDQLSSDLLSMGFSGKNALNDYYIYSLKTTAFARDYFNSKKTDIENYIEENNSKIISHILIKVADVETVTNDDGTTSLVAHPTDDEQKKLDDVLKALETKDFSEVAIEYSDDTSASGGGSLGYYDKETAASYVQEFSNVANELSEGQVSEPVVSSYGYHIIRCDASTYDSLLASDTFISKLISAFNNEYSLAVLNKGEELGFEIKDEEIKEFIENLKTQYSETEESDEVQENDETNVDAEEAQ